MSYWPCLTYKREPSMRNQKVYRQKMNTVLLILLRCVYFINLFHRLDHEKSSFLIYRNSLRESWWKATMYIVNRDQEMSWYIHQSSSSALLCFPLIISDTYSILYLKQIEILCAALGLLILQDWAPGSCPKSCLYEAKHNLIFAPPLIDGLMDGWILFSKG